MFKFITRDICCIEENEITIAVIHRHWFDILKNFFLIFLMSVFLGGIHFFLPPLFSILETDEFYSLLVLFEISFSMLILILFFLIWIDYYFDVWIITNKRIINIEQKGLFSREISELELNKIQDVSAHVSGVIPTFLDYGDVFVQTAGERERFIFKKISAPYATKDLIMSLEKNNEKAIEKEKAMGEAREIKSALQDSQIK
ncbi:MAG: hypothetical protein ACD_15C00059G0026 [uncultured bacterium]|nr:MAG: hypothetical protein ACD_15C00059G0026 [uncultured bacterium]